MVVLSSDSCNTLVSLNNDKKTAQYQQPQVTCEQLEKQEFLKTSLCLPAEDYVNDEGCVVQHPEQNVFLPTSMPVDKFFKYIPQVVESCDEILANDPRHFTGKSKDRVLYVAQGELGHVLPSQADVIVSDKATTCHILGIRSVSKCNPPLSSLTHIDSTSYEQCIRTMFEEHLKYNAPAAIEAHGDMVEMDIHVVGGFDDEKSSSLQISSWLVNLLASIAEEQKDVCKMVLRTCAISCMNDTGHSCPIGRGLGLDVHTGTAFLCKVDEEVVGPMPSLRSARIWSNTGANVLSVIHTHLSDKVYIQPFSYRPFPELERLLALPDDLLLRYTSTSPEVEESDFCNSVRSTLRFLRDVNCKRVFGSGVDQPLFFRRVACNAWKRTK